MPRQMRLGHILGWGMLLSEMVGCGVQHPTSFPSLPHIVACYVLPHGTQGQMTCRQYNAHGRPVGAAQSLGPLGLVAEAQVAGSWPGGFVVTTGRLIETVVNYHTREWVRVPRGWTILSVRRIHGRLWFVAENLHHQQLRAGKALTAGHWSWARQPIPLGITTLVRTANDLPAVAVMTPTSAQVIYLEGQKNLPPLVNVAPQGSVGFWSGAALVPYAKGSSSFGVAKLTTHGIMRQRAPSVYRAVIEISDTNPPWGVTVRGMVPIQKGQGVFSHLVPWPHPMPGTMTIVGSGHPWILVVDGNSQGVWFNTQTGHYGPRFQINTPWRAVVRAIALGS